MSFFLFKIIKIKIKINEEMTLFLVKHKIKHWKWEKKKLFVIYPLELWEIFLNEFIFSMLQKIDFLWSYVPPFHSCGRCYLPSHSSKGCGHELRLSCTNKDVSHGTLRWYNPVDLNGQSSF